MLTPQQARSNRVEAWLAEGAVVLTANERAARSVLAAFHARRRAEGRTAWPTPAILPWENWLRERWLERNHAGLVLLNPLQERALWAEVIAASSAGQNLLNPVRLASAAQQAFRLLCQYAPESLTRGARGSWADDSAVFSEWLADFDARCVKERLISTSRLPLELMADLLSLADSAARPPLLLIGFDRLTATQKSLLDSWGGWQVDDDGSPQVQIGLNSEPTSLFHGQPNFFHARDFAGELAACVRWLRQELAANPGARLMVITPGLAQCQGELERAMLQSPEAGEHKLRFEFSLGRPLGSVGLVRAALLLLRWLNEPLTEAELDWVISSGHAASRADEQSELAQTMLELRRKGLERTEWTLKAWLDLSGSRAKGPEFASRPGEADSLPKSFSARLAEAQQQLQLAQQMQSPAGWAELAEQLLETAGWPGYRSLDSEAFQATQSWQKVLEGCATLGLIEANQRISWAEFLSTLASAVSEAVFAAESEDAPILITEPLESAGQLADGIWFLGANEDNWPGRGSPHPLLPFWLQRNAEMPHATALADWGLARQVTSRLLASAPKVVFSYAGQAAKAEARPSRLIVRSVGAPIPLPKNLRRESEPSRKPLATVILDKSQIPFPRASISGGAAGLNSQSLCPFQAFARTRLGAEHWEFAEAGLNARQRGKLLHDVLHRVWNPAEGGLGGLDDLRAEPDLPGFVSGIVRSVFRDKLPSPWRETVPERFLELEAARLTRLVSEWLTYESTRQQFSVEGTEVKYQVTVAGLSLNLRLDRVDSLAGGAKLVVDYKSSDVGPSAWEGERPDDIQLPLYAAFAVSDRPDSERLEGLVIARVKPGKMEFSGRLRDAAGTLLAGLDRRKALLKNPLTSQQLSAWQAVIERLATDFLAGRAEVDPKDGLKTCEGCHLHAVCRVYENQTLAALEDEAEDEAEVSDE